ncbi:hypothetical protein N7462_000868 [Penicillium macrosclerotiorum]|uniref:uncharacterized protein n=1 Tax=Penicillium macrosclerotiorum TaxID=303699 RepID=UPI002546EE2F|nr:uncharacterized protein N7462_000868 [Penicillium macrosclerotiorum]KAJ5698863.1 hypothetical protein N7462_000868 [Penicillium macrosclerotiorum]
MVLPDDLVKIMSLRPDMPCPEEGMEGFYEGMGQGWTGVDTPGFQTPYMGVNGPSGPYCTESLHPSNILTPISLADNSFRPSPALSHISHQSQEYPPPDYGHRYSTSSIHETLPPLSQGLGITGPFPSEYPRGSDYPRTSSSGSSYGYLPDEIHFNMGHTPNISPSTNPPKRLKRASATPSRDTPINILPNPEGLQRMELERQNSLNSPPHVQPKLRAPGRGRRDPRAEEEDAFVEDLRQQNLAWKVVREMFRQRFDKDASEARLQMRLLRRRKERLSRWDDHDVQLLITSHEMWENEKYQFVSEKMKEMGSTKEYTPEQCKAQLRLLEARQGRRDYGSASPSALSDPPLSPSIQASLSRKRSQAELEDEY